jgi:hypothetical protein
MKEREENDGWVRLSVACALPSQSLACIDLLAKLETEKFYFLKDSRKPKNRQEWQHEVWKLLIYFEVVVVSFYLCTDCSVTTGNGKTARQYYTHRLTDFRETQCEHHDTGHVPSWNSLTCCYQQNRYYRHANLCAGGNTNAIECRV